MQHYDVGRKLLSCLLSLVNDYYDADALDYHVILNKLPVGDKDLISLKLDTGASATVISLHTFFMISMTHRKTCYTERIRLFLTPES